MKINVTFNEKTKKGKKIIDFVQQIPRVKKIDNKYILSKKGTSLLLHFLENEL